MAGRTSCLLHQLQLTLLVLLLLGVSLFFHRVIVVVLIVAVLGGVAGFEEHGEQVVPSILRVIQAEASAGVLHTDAGQELNEERSVEILTELVHYEPGK